jgi:hypothetical protein
MDPVEYEAKMFLSLNAALHDAGTSVVLLFLLLFGFQCFSNNNRFD